MKTLRVAVAGAGLGGLCLALFLATCGQASRRMTIVSEKLRVLHEQVAADHGADPFALYRRLPGSPYPRCV